MAGKLWLRVARTAAVRLQQMAERAERRRIQLECQAQGLVRAANIRTYTTKGELETLYRLGESLPVGANVVEFGSYLGASTTFLAAAVIPKGGKVTAIDMWKNETMPDGPRDTFSEFQTNIAEVADHVRIIRKRTGDINADDLRPPVHMAFIDADHSYEATAADSALAAAHLAPGGLLVFHDATTFSGVGRAVAEMLATTEWYIAGRFESLVWIRRAAWAKWPLITGTLP